MKKIYVKKIRDLYTDVLKKILIEYFDELGNTAFINEYDAFIRSKKTKENFVNWIFYDGEKAGFIIYRIIKHHFKPIHIGHIDELYVKKEFRGLGIAKRAVSLIINKLKKNKVLRIDLDVIGQNIIAKKFWTALGFNKTSEHYRKEFF